MSSNEQNISPTPTKLIFSTGRLCGWWYDSQSRLITQRVSLDETPIPCGRTTVCVPLSKQQSLQSRTRSSLVCFKGLLVSRMTTAETSLQVLSDWIHFDMNHEVSPTQIAFFLHSFIVLSDALFKSAAKAKKSKVNYSDSRKYLHLALGVF